VVGDAGGGVGLVALEVVVVEVHVAHVLDAGVQPVADEDVIKRLQLAVELERVAVFGRRLRPQVLSVTPGATRFCVSAGESSKSLRSPMTMTCRPAASMAAASSCRNVA
jgi:hypothetical protein